jgi:hypothetical protein
MHLSARDLTITVLQWHLFVVCVCCIIDLLLISIADLTLKSSIIIPAGATLVVPLHRVQMDVSVWGHDACQFNPSRLLQKEIDLGGRSLPPHFISTSMLCPRPHLLILWCI